jgi:Zn finger protein HypA/HybF involved in hydrogenase expression
MEEKNIITCKKCGDIIISEHGNMKYCSNCRIDKLISIESNYIYTNIGKSTPFNKKKIKKWVNIY